MRRGDARREARAAQDAGGRYPRARQGGRVVGLRGVRDCVPSPRRRLPDGRRPRHVVARRSLRRGRQLRLRVDGIRGAAVHAVHVGFDGETKGDRALHRGVHDRHPHDVQVHVRLQTRGGVLVHGGYRLDHGALVHRLRTPARTRHHGDVRGRAHLPRRGAVLGHLREAQGEPVLHRPHRGSRAHEGWGRVRHQVRSFEHSHPRFGRRADQPRGVAMVLPGGGRVAVPDRGHVLADRDGLVHDHPAPRRHPAQARIRHPSHVRRRTRHPRR